MNNRELAYNLRNSIRDCLEEEIDLYLNGEYGNFDKEKFFGILKKEATAYINELEQNWDWEEEEEDD
jgi:hypothetical protein